MVLVPEKKGLQAGSRARGHEISYQYPVITMTRHLTNKLAFLIVFSISVAAFIAVLPGSAYATQEHSDPEGLYSHLIAHMFFISAMIALSVQIFRTRGRKPGWRHIGIAAILFLLWNLDTFSVHIIREFLPREIFTSPGGIWTTHIDLSSTEAKIFYIGKLFDHVFLLSSVYVFLKGILAFQRGLTEEEIQ